MAECDSAGVEAETNSGVDVNCPARADNLL